ncbi:hypothetical protein IHV09_21950 [Fictibacillus sp. 23RED33]|uniref:hypothetical protein n=1 Tax=Fictibacillus sp. 23RED33 TaxID=2745879 RepID=UPI0018CC804F|nr:hypothetical protein [Fictibacillus sp. 23RED33]MBH0176223.1 hypothetical protein [Fictibacillus sp. 23RED33]
MDIYDISLYLKELSDKADEIKKLDRDSYKHYNDKQIIEMILDEKIESLKNGI